MMKDKTELLEQTLQFELPYTNTEYCYQHLSEFPQLIQLFQEKIVTLAVSGGPLTGRLVEIEAEREKALMEYEAGKPTLREHEPPFNCCIGDLYYALFDSLAIAVNKSDLDFEEKAELMTTLRDALGEVLDWDVTKRMEIGFRLLPE